MLTPQQVKNHRFQLGSRGTYRAEEVDAFVQELTASFEEAYTQNEALLKKSAFWRIRWKNTAGMRIRFARPCLLHSAQRIKLCARQRRRQMLASPGRRTGRRPWKKKPTPVPAR